MRTATIAEIAAPEARSIAIGPFGSALRADRYTSSGVPVVRGQNIGDRWGLTTDDVVYVARETADEFPACVVRPGDLVFPHRGAIGRVARVDDQEWLLSSSMMKLTVDPDVADSRFVLLYFRDKGRDELLNRASTVGTPGIGQPLTSLRSIPIPLPPLSEQQAIAEVLGALDDKIAANTTLAASVDRYLSTEFEGRLRREATTNALLSGVATVVLGGTPSRARPDYWADGTVPWLNSGAANATRIVAPSEHITAEALAKSAAKMMPIGATLIAITGATLGQVARLEIEASGNQSLVGVWSTDAALNTWLYFAIRARLDDLLARATGAAQQHVSKGDVGSLEVPLADRAGMQDFADTAMPLLDAAALAERENRTLATIRDALLPQLMSGNLRVRDAEKVAEEAGA